jgi:hypothetical protein
VYSADRDGVRPHQMDRLNSKYYDIPVSDDYRGPVGRAFSTSKGSYCDILESECDRMISRDIIDVSDNPMIMLNVGTDRCWIEFSSPPNRSLSGGS